MTPEIQNDVNPTESANDAAIFDVWVRLFACTAGM